MAKIEGLLGPSCGYTDLIDENLISKYEQETSKPPQWNPLRPSASGYCARRLAYDYKEFKEGKRLFSPEERTPETLRLLRLGNSIEFHVLSYLRDIEYFQVKYTQQSLDFGRISPDQILEGSTDLVIYSPEHRVISDVKSKKDKFKQPKKTDWDATNTKLKKMESVQQISETAFWIEELPTFLNELNDPFLADNFLQLNLYSMNPFIQDRGIDHAFVYQYNKNDSRHRELRFKPSRELYEYVIEKFKKVAANQIETADPEKINREFDLGSIRCAFCARAKECWPDDDAKQAFFKTFWK